MIAIIVGILILPLIIVISILILLESKGGVIFSQKRIGLNKNEFVILKFRTMENQKITFIGNIIRRLGWDEIPQLINIIKGEMAFVGPRPLTSNDITRLGWDTKQYGKRWSVKPGITGLAQLSPICNSRLAMENDLFYVENKSLGLDLKIIFRSLLIPVLGKQTQ